jgi:hypothetical protein
MRFLSSTLLASALVLTSLICSPAFANDPPKKPAAKEEPPKPKFNYAEEDGEHGRSGYVYKHVVKPAFEEPKELPKAEPKEAHKPEPKDSHGKKDDHGKPDDHGKKDDHGKPDDHGKKDDGHGAPKKEEKKDDGHGAPPKKEEKKKDDGHGAPKKDDGHGGGHGGGHGKEDKKPAVAPVSAVYDPAIIKLDGNNRPHTPVMFTNKFADYFVCHKTIKDKYRETVLAEMNTFADRMGLPRAQDMPCMIKIAKPNTKFPGSVYIEFYTDVKAEKECIKKGECGSTRLMMLHPKDKTGIKSKDIYRSYVLTDEKKFRRANFCVSPDGQLLGEKHCYVVLNPDWLFN